ncbi:MAG: hypothetical protein HJJLKODD_00726 [Phycisphaerae bacterium]|nr:hypothetical protein [Phycisphaerae bacterium]
MKTTIMGMVVGMVVSILGCNQPSSNQVEVAAEHQPAAVQLATSFTIDLQRGDWKYQRLLAQPATRGLHSGLVKLKPGEECGRHNTEIYEEMLVILQGEGEAVNISTGTRFNLRVDQIVYIPPHTEHNIRNVGEGPLHYIYIVSPTEPLPPMEDHPSGGEH